MGEFSELWASRKRLEPEDALQFEKGPGRNQGQRARGTIQMGLIIDTGIFIKAEREARTDLARLYPAGEDVGICTITVSELYEGVHLAENPKRAADRREFIEQFALVLPVFDFNMNAALQHATSAPPSGSGAR